MPEAVIVDAIRTPIGRAGKGSLKSVRADELAALPIRTLIERNPDVDFAQTNDVLMGAASGVGEQGYNVGRNAALLAGSGPPRPGCTVNRFCASSLMTIRMASHAIRAGEGDQYIAAGVEAVSRAGLGAGMMEETKNVKLNGSEGSLYDVYIPMGMTAENVAERCKVTPRAAGRVGGHLPEPRRRGARLRPLRRRDRPGHRARAHGDRPGGQRGRRPRDGRRQGRRPPPGHDDGGPGASSSRRSSPTAPSPPATPARSTTAPPPCSSCPTRRPSELGVEAAGADHRLDRRRDPPRDHGPRPDPGDPGAARADRDDDRRHRHRRDQRGVRRPDRALPGRAGHPRGEAQPVRRRDRARPPVRDDRRADHDDAASTACARVDGRYGIESMCVAGGMGQAMLIERLL